MSELQLAMNVLRLCNSIDHWMAEYHSTDETLYRENCKIAVGDEWVKMVYAFIELQGVSDRMVILPLVTITNKARDKVVPFLELVEPTE